MDLSRSRDVERIKGVDEQAIGGVMDSEVTFTIGPFVTCVLFSLIIELELGSRVVDSAVVTFGALVETSVRGTDRVVLPLVEAIVPVVDLSEFDSTFGLLLLSNTVSNAVAVEVLTEGSFATGYFLSNSSGLGSRFRGQEIIRRVVFGFAVGKSDQKSMSESLSINL